MSINSRRGYKVCEQSERTFLIKSPRYPRLLFGPKVRNLLQRVLAVKSSIKVRMNVEHWWNDTDRGKAKYSEQSLPH
jgi:hypothetical protein